MSEQKSFPLPSDLEVVPGTEAAQAAYPYYTRFVPEDDGKFWFYNSMHFPEPMHHFDMITAEAAYVALGAFNTRVHVLPTAKGIEHRVINGRVYIGGVAVTDPEEIHERVGEFQQRAFYYYEHWEDLYAQWKDKMKALIADAQALPKPALPDYEPLETLNHGLRLVSSSASHSWPAPPTLSRSASTSSMFMLSMRWWSTPSSTARRARRFTSSSGRKISASIPATMRLIAWSEISGNAFLQKSKKVMYAP